MAKNERVIRTIHKRPEDLAWNRQMYKLGMMTEAEYLHMCKPMRVVAPALEDLSDEKFADEFQKALG